MREGRVGHQIAYLAFLSNPEASSMNTDRYFPVSSLWPF